MNSAIHIEAKQTKKSIKQAEKSIINVLKICAKEKVSESVTKFALDQLNKVSNIDGVTVSNCTIHGK